MFTQRVALFDQSGVFNYEDLYVTLDTLVDQLSILHPVCSTKTKTIHSKFVYDELANGNDLNFEVSILFQSLVSCFKTFIKFSE